MLALLKAENLKMKHTVARKMIWLGPIAMVLLAFVMNPLYLYGDALNWWYAFILFIHIALTCALIHQKEDKKLNYFPVFMMPVKLKKSWMGKCLLGAEYTLIYAIAFGIILSGAAFYWKGTIENGFGGTLFAVIMVCAINLWQIPIYLILAKKAGFYAPIVFSAVGIVGAVIYSTKSIWWCCPFAWGERLMCTIAGYMPNGLNITEEYNYLLVSKTTIVVVVLASLLLFALFSWLTSEVFKREVR